MSSLTVNIAGAGISGLVLGRCLLSHGIRPVIFEKSRQSIHKNNHAITLNAHTYKPLLGVLGLSDETFKQRVAVDAAVGGSGRLSSSSDEHPCFRANRARFEQLLAEGLDVKWENEISAVTPATSSGLSAVLHVKGAWTATAFPSSVVVAADGPHSRARSSVAKFMTTERALKVLPYATYNGSRQLSPQEFDDAFGASMADDTVLEQRIYHAKKWVYLQISISDRTKDGVLISYTYSRPARERNDRLYRPLRPKHEAEKIPSELFAEVDLLRSELEGPFGVVFDTEAMRKDRLLNWLMRSTPLPLRQGHFERAAKGGVVLLGDALHAEPILGGQGANRAIEDGMTLADLLLAALLAQDDINLWEFYNLRSEAWAESVRESELRLEQLHKGEPQAAL